jgi:hypothetical protein
MRARRNRSSFPSEAPGHPLRTSRLVGGSNTTVTQRLPQVGHMSRESSRESGKFGPRATCRNRAACDRRIAGWTSCPGDGHRNTAYAPPAEASRRPQCLDFHENESGTLVGLGQALGWFYAYVYVNCITRGKMQMSDIHEVRELLSLVQPIRE